VLSDVVIVIPRNPVAVLATNKTAVYVSVNTAGVALDQHDYRTTTTSSSSAVTVAPNLAEAVLT
jgi:hypothetical protein